MPDGPRHLDYMDDPFGWVQAQLPLLDDWPRRADQIDLAGLRELMEDRALEMLAIVKGNLRQLMAHLMKAALTRKPQVISHWHGECLNFHAQALDAYKRSMNQQLDMQNLWKGARRFVTASFDDFGEPPPNLPKDCPFTRDQLLDPDLDVKCLVADLRRRFGTTDDIERED